ncbi:hypothetical protein V8F20_007969 [Naviculisporaceae sp. PSN 640]
MKYHLSTHLAVLVTGATLSAATTLVPVSGGTIAPVPSAPVGTTAAGGGTPAPIPTVPLGTTTGGGGTVAPVPTEPVGTTAGGGGTVIPGFTEPVGGTVAPVPTNPVVTDGFVISARQVPAVTVTAAINKADHSGPGDHDDDSAEFRSGVGSLFTKATSAVGEALKSETASIGAATTSTGNSAAGQLAVSGRDATLMAVLAAWVAAGLLL